jgi:hypothetical protein
MNFNDTLIPLFIFNLLHSHKNVKFFIPLFLVYSSVSSFYFISAFAHFEDVSTAHNFLQFIFKIITYVGRFLIIVFAMVESLVKRQKIEKLLNISEKIEKIFLVSFNYSMSFDELKKVMRRRQILIFAGLFLVEFLPLTKGISLYSVALCGSKFVGATIISLTVFKFCYCMDLVNLHLNTLTVVTER